MEKKRIIYFDYLRVVAIIAVIVLHVSAQNWNEFGGRSFEWNVFNFYDSIVRWGVPVFLMISGALFLPREIETKKLYSKYILRLFVAYCIWAIFYAIVLPVDKFIPGHGFEMSYKLIISNMITGSYHMWFIPMIIGIYMCIPLLKQITKTKKCINYFLILSLVFSFIIPQLVNMSNDFVGGSFSLIINRINEVISDMNMDLVLGYSFYFVLGYFLNNIQLSKKQRLIVYILGVVGFLSTILLNGVVAWKTQVPCKTYYGNFNINVFLEALSVYIWFKYKHYNNEKLNKVIVKLSKCSFGAYLVHVFVIDVLRVIGINTIQFSPIISVPIISLVTLVLSYFISFIINKIPVLNKWIV